MKKERRRRRGSKKGDEGNRKGEILFMSRRKERGENEVYK